MGFGVWYKLRLWHELGKISIWGALFGLLYLMYTSTIKPSRLYYIFQVERSIFIIVEGSLPLARRMLLALRPYHQPNLLEASQLLASTIYQYTLKTVKRPQLTSCIRSTIYSLSGTFASVYVVSSNFETISATMRCWSS